MILRPLCAGGLDVRLCTLLEPRLPLGEEVYSIRDEHSTWTEPVADVAVDAGMRRPASGWRQLHTLLE